MKTLIITSFIVLMSFTLKADEVVGRIVDIYEKPNFDSPSVTGYSSGEEGESEETDQQKPNDKKESVKSVPEAKAKSKPSKIGHASARNSRARSGRSSSARGSRSSSPSRGRGH
jgi:hypothetical protein